MKFNTEFTWTWNAFGFGGGYFKNEGLIISIGFLNVIFTKED